MPPRAHRERIFRKVFDYSGADLSHSISMARNSGKQPSIINWPKLVVRR